LDWVSRNDEVPATDLLLVAGDIANRDMHAEDFDKAPTISKVTSEMSLVLTNLEDVCAKLVYVPGNHDSPTAVTEPLPSLSVNSCNAHGRQVRVLPDLAIVGVGGSTPAVYDDKPLEWSAFPYRSDADLKEVLDRALRAPEEDPAAEENEGMKQAQEMMDAVNLSLKMMPHPVVCPEERVNPDKDFSILLTHEGAHISNTTIDYVLGPLGPIYSGSASITATLEKGPIQFNLVVHGHTHNARGFNILPRGTLNINPGALCEGNFATCTLVKRPDAPKWTVDNVQLHSLPPLPVSEETRA